MHEVVPVRDNHHQGLKGETPDKALGGGETGKQNVWASWAHGSSDDV